MNAFKNPLGLMFGYGTGNFALGASDAISEFSGMSVAGHDRLGTRLFFYQLFVENGLLGLILYFYLHFKVYTLASRLQDKHPNSEYPYLLPALKYGMVASLIASCIEINFYSFYYIGIILLYKKHIENTSIYCDSKIFNNK